MLYLTRTSTYILFFHGQLEPLVPPSPTRQPHFYTQSYVACEFLEIFTNSGKRHIRDVKKSWLKACFTYISKLQSDFMISQGLYYRETLHMRSFSKNKTLTKIYEFTVWMRLSWRFFKIKINCQLTEIILACDVWILICTVQNVVASR